MIPRVTVSLVTYDGMRWLPGCLDSLRAQTLADWELLVLDNASSDGSSAWLQLTADDEPRMRVRVADRNLGYAVGHNRLIGEARGEAVLLLNQDVELDPGFLEAAVAVLDGRERVAAVQGRILRLGSDGERTSTIDSTGLVMGRDRRVVARGQTEADGPRWSVAGPVWGADGPAPVYRRSALLAAREPRTGGGWEVLDEDFFMYKEDVDLAWRLRNLGWEAWYEPRSLAWHARGAAGGDPSSLRDMLRARSVIPAWIRDLSWRNHRLMQIKNESPVGYVRDLPWILRREVPSLAALVIPDVRRVVVLRELLRSAPAALRKRRSLGSRLGIPPPTA